MGTVPTTHTWAPGDLLTAANMNTFLSTAVAFFVAPPHILTIGGTAQKTANNTTNTAADLGAVNASANNDSMDSALPTTITCKTAGTFQMGGMVNWQGNATGYRRIGINDSVNGLACVVDGLPGNNNECQLTTSGIGKMAVNGTFTLQIYQNSGGGLDYAGTNCNTFLRTFGWAMWIGT